MLGQLPVPMSEAIEVIIEVKVFYHNGYTTNGPTPGSRYRGYSSYKDKSDVYSNQDYKHVAVWSTEEKKPKYKKYRISLKRPVCIDEYDVDMIDEKLNKLGL